MAAMQKAAAEVAAGTALLSAAAAMAEREHERPL